MAAVEAMASGLPLITSNVHGINDYSVNEQTGYSCAPDDYYAFARSIVKMKDDYESRNVFGCKNAVIAENYDKKKSDHQMKEIYIKF